MLLAFPAICLQNAALSVIYSQQLASQMRNYWIMQSAAAENNHEDPGVQANFYGDFYATHENIRVSYCPTIQYKSLPGFGKFLWIQGFRIMPLKGPLFPCQPRIHMLR